MTLPWSGGQMHTAHQFHVMAYHCARSFQRNNMASSLKIISVNCRGLANRERRQDLFSKLKEDKVDIAMLQDTHWDTRTAFLAKEEWGYKICCSPFSTHARGTAILTSNSFEFEVENITIDKSGNYTIIEMILHNGFTLVLGSIYGPNSDSPEFIINITREIQKMENPNILLAGDWNCTRDFKFYNLYYVTQNNTKVMKEIINMCNTINLVDPWLVNNLNKKQYTWSQGISNKQSRLDYFLYNEELLSITSNFKILPKYRSDHAPIVCNLQISEQNRGPGVWKINNSLLQDEEFIKMVKKEINTFKSIYALTPYHPDFVEVSSHGFEIMISHTLFWETLLVTLRGAIIRYSKNKKRKTNQQKKN